MRVLQVITSGEHGGAQAYLVELVRALADAGIGVEVACGPGSWLPAQLRGIARVHRVRHLVRAPSPIADVRAFAALVSLARGRDAVHTHSAKAGALGRLAAAIARVPRIVHTSHGSFLDERIAPARRVAYLAVERIAAAVTSHLFVLSEADRATMLSAGLYRGTPYGVVRLATSRVRLPSGRWRPRERPVVAAVANFYPNKGLDVLVEAFRLLSVEHPASELRIVGEGPERANLERSIRAMSTVRLVGHLDDPSEEMLAASVFVLPSRKEGVPLALLEALALGVPSVATRVGGIAEIVLDGEAVLVPPDDPLALAHAISGVLRSRERALQLSAGALRAADRVVAGSSVSPVIDAYRSVDSTRP